MQTDSPVGKKPAVLREFRLERSGGLIDRLFVRVAAAPRVRYFGRGLVALIAFSILFGWLAGVGHVQLDHPLAYNGDALETLAYFDHDYIANDFDTRLHAPFELEHKQNWYYIYNALFQSNSNLIWLAHLAGGGSMVRTLNLAYLATFLLVFLSAYWVCGRLGLGDPYRFGAASLYALMPYHFQRSVNHFWESSYYLTPLLALVILQLWSARPLAHRWGPQGWQFTWRDPRAIFALVLILFLSSFHPYHQFFFAILAASVAPLAALYRKSWRPLMVGVGLAILAMGVLLLKDGITHALVSPELALSINGQAISGYGSAEVFPLKLTQMLLPVQGHRWHALAAVRAMYDAANPLNNENQTTTLGLLGSFGLLASLALALVPSSRWRMSRGGKMGVITLLAVLFASMGGISSLISTVSMVLMGPTFILTQARGWDRMIIFVGFFSYFTAFWLLGKGVFCLRRHLPAKLSRAAIAWPIFMVVFGAALWDQVPYVISQQNSDHFLSDQRFFGRLEATLPAQARVMQLPFLVHHVSAWVQPGVYYTDALRPYLSSKMLHFTYGGDQGSVQIQWLKTVTDLPADQSAPYLCRYGFSGVLLQRNMVNDPTAMEQVWVAHLGALPWVSDDRNFSFFDLRTFCASHAIAPLDLHALKASLIEKNEGASHSIAAAAFPHLIGHVASEPDGNVAIVGTAEENGWLGFGPYESLNPGHYQVRFNLADIDIPPDNPITLDVAAQRLGRDVQLAQAKIAVTENAPPVLSFTVAPGDSLLQYRIYKPRGASVRFEGVEILKTDD